MGNPEKDHAAIEKSIEQAITSLGWLGRKIARNRLANHKELPPRTEVSRAGDNVSIVMGKYSAVAPMDGSERELIGPNGRDSKRKSAYSFNDAGQLVMTVYMTSEKLASPIEYDLVYAPTQ